MSAFEVLEDQLPSGVVHQLAPLDTPAAINAFFGYWKPSAIMIVESELWPNLIVGASENGVSVVIILYEGCIGVAKCQDVCQII